MTLSRSHRRSLMAWVCASALAIAASPASAEPISWTTWTSGIVSATAGSASGTIADLGLSVAYTGEMRGFDGLLNWLPVSSFTGGTVDNAPPSGPSVTNDGIALIGGGADPVVNTVTFSAPVVNPMLAIWSLGRPTAEAQFLFLASEPFLIQAGGPNSEFGGSSIFAGGICPANTTCGSEGNGVVQFDGTFSALSWTNPLSENYYAFTVGATSLDGMNPVPEPATLLLLGSGLVGAGVRRWWKQRN